MTDIRHLHFPNRYRLGDTIALYDLASYIRDELDPLLTFSTGPHVGPVGLLEMMASEKGLFVPRKEDDEVFDDLNLWIWNDYLRSIDYRVTYDPKPLGTDSLPTRPEIVFAPLLDVEYSFERTMHLSFVCSLIRELPGDRQTVVLVAPDTTISDREVIADVCNESGAVPLDASLEMAFRLIGTTDVYIGGDTGLTHFAGHVMSTGVVALHDRGNTERHIEREYDHQRKNRDAIRDHITEMTGEVAFESYRPTYYSGPNRNAGARQILFARHGCDGVTLGKVIEAIGEVKSEVG